MTPIEQHADDSPKASLPPVDDLLTGLPLLHTWRSVYIFVTASFVVWVVLLTALMRMFS